MRSTEIDHMIGEWRKRGRAALKPTQGRWRAFIARTIRDYRHQQSLMAGVTIVTMECFDACPAEVQKAAMALIPSDEGHTVHTEDSCTR